MHWPHSVLGNETGLFGWPAKPAEQRHSWIGFETPLKKLPAGWPASVRKNMQVVRAMERRQSIWVFPVYVLAANAARDGNGSIVLDEDVRFATPEIRPGKPSLAVFTDSEWAEVFVRSSLTGHFLSAVTLGPESFLALLRRAQSNYQLIAVDPDPHSRLARFFDVSDLIGQIEQHLGQDRPDDPTDQ